MKQFKILSSPRFVFSFFTLIHFVLLNSGIKQHGNFLSSQLDVTAPPRQLCECTASANVYADQCALNPDYHDNEGSFELGNEHIDDGTSGQVEHIECEEEDEVRGVEELGKLEGGQEEEWDVEDDDKDLKNYEGAINIASILKKHLPLMPKDEVEFLLIECVRIQISDYYGAMDNLLSELHELASKYGMPEEEKMKLWNECEQELSKDFKEVDDYYHEIYNINMKADTVETVSFLSSLTNFLNLWKKCLQETEKKWYTIFNERTQEYKASAQETVLDA
ncbi:hypothetical protein AK88_05232 [Plasmodium fragile]|uniref:Plasmodium RESA N-terminal domain-containing protein n=1 Tax=Plasmodium fragile TaxID=5857 RepID=A0A0D9QDL7_PLAFR|nr:uncharacterized protein AK88_05232 [Plasmodium fragile]KJP85135.1 hypothetical protein AK88_05232 [Plasmodium fragile]